MELEDGYDVSKDVTLLRDRVCTVWKELTTDGEMDTCKPLAMELD